MNPLRHAILALVLPLVVIVGTVSIWFYRFQEWLFECDS